MPCVCSDVIPSNSSSTATVAALMNAATGSARATRDDEHVILTQLDELAQTLGRTLPGRATLATFPLTHLVERAGERQTSPFDDRLDTHRFEAERLQVRGIDVGIVGIREIVETDATVERLLAALVDARV